MTKKNDGGAAFPMSSGPTNYAEHGMSLRDWFAGQAMSGLIGRLEGKTDRLEEIGRVVSVAAYVIADAMLADRDK